MTYVTTTSEITDKEILLYVKYLQMGGEAYELLNINGNALINPIN